MTTNRHHINHTESEDFWWSSQSKVVCIKNDGFESYLTQDKVYTLLDGEKNFFSPIKIIDDSGREFNYDDSRFISLEDWRGLKLGELGV